MTLDKDLMGAFISGICLIHCLAGPVLILLGVASVGHAHIDEESIHFALLAPILFFAAWSIPKGLKSHHNRKPAIFSVVGIGLILIGFIVSDLSLILTVGGSLSLLAAHLYNRKLLKML